MVSIILRARCEWATVPRGACHISPMTTLAAWSSRHAVPEAYRVTRLPSSHGGAVGWQLTLWRSGKAWCAARTTLHLGVPVPALTSGHRLSLRRAAPLLRAVERADLWAAPPWPDVPRPDGFEIRVEAWRAGQTMARGCHAPDPVVHDQAWQLFDTFGRPAPTPLDALAQGLPLNAAPGPAPPRPGSLETPGAGPP